MSSFEYARAHGLMAPDVVAAHCYVVDDADIALLAETRTAVAHCPLMNAVRGHIAPVAELRRRGVTVGLGIDNMFADYFDVVPGVRPDGADSRPRRGDHADAGGARARHPGRGAGARARPGDRIHRGGQARGPGRPRLPRVRPRRRRSIPSRTSSTTATRRTSRPCSSTVASWSTSGGWSTSTAPRSIDAAQDAATAAWSRFIAKYGGIMACLARAEPPRSEADGEHSRASGRDHRCACSISTAPWSTCRRASPRRSTPVPPRRRAGRATRTRS